MTKNPFSEKRVDKFCKWLKTKEGINAIKNIEKEKANFFEIIDNMNYIEPEYWNIHYTI